ncbi:exonuclease VII small subunit [Sphingopyxis italica]|uniref:Exonuclease VII small subunit n=1 Tax=Sphingopyxis italica TaxID=1129133 RepID=A0A7X5XSP1_9SPHN|nr:hypothetical protein [Sphingopyxis italica]NJB90555.1 exonuclease VII small subunit [Sphingopyxis italica]
MNVPAKRIDDSELEMALADLEVARTFKDAADLFLEGAQSVVRPDGDAPNKVLLWDLHKAETLLSEMICRIERAEKRIEQVMKAVAA